MAHTYVYAVIPGGKRGVFEVSGVGDDPVYTIPRDSVSAVVSTSPLASYQGLGREQAVRHLLAHQRVVEAVMREGPVLPAQFGTVLPGENWVYRLLEQGERILYQALDKLHGRVQMEIVVLWNLQEVFQEIGQEGPIVELKAQIAERPATDTTMQRVMVGQLVQASLERRRTALRERLIDSLHKMAVELVINPVMDDTMVANVAMLVDDTGREKVEAEVQHLDQEFNGQLLFRLVGPLPPYSFATVNVQVPSFAAVDAARGLLGLGETAAPGSIKQAYHRLASQMHPDRNVEDAEAQTRMTELAQAYKLLSSYADGRTVCHFDRSAVEQTLLISIQRQEMPA